MESGGETLAGAVERVVYANEETGFTVAKLRVEGQRDTTTVVGSLSGLRAGETVHLEGKWVSHPRFGMQFQVERYEMVLPATLNGIQKYLASGLIKGIGPVMAGRLVERFGQDTIRVIDDESHRLLEVEGIGAVRLGRIRAAWDEQREVRGIMVFLQSQGVSAALAARIYRQYGHRSVGLLRENPYRLASEVFGIGFKTADQIAQRLGISPASPQRVRAGLLHLLGEVAQQGHVFFPDTSLMERAEQLLGVEPAAVREALNGLAAEGRVVLDAPVPSSTEAAVYLSSFFREEEEVAAKIAALLGGPRQVPGQVLPSLLEGIEALWGFTLALRQRRALQRALEEKFLVITGGPGTGKTTLVRGILAVYEALGRKALLAAPTGRAAKRLSEATGADARTIHRLLEWRYDHRGFFRDALNPLRADLVVVDEASMIDISLMARLLDAVPAEATVILVGDSQQLPAVGPGNVLRDLIDSGCVPMVRLTEVFRQAQESLIVTNAHRILSGEAPLSRGGEGVRHDFWFLREDDPHRALACIEELCARRLPTAFGYDPLRDIQVITPMHRGVVGAANLNQGLQDRLNPGGKRLERGTRAFRVGDKVMQIANDYDKEVFNGDIGWLRSIDDEEQEVEVEFDPRRVRYDYGELDELALAYAISVHKSQGSEYRAVILPLLPQHYVMLRRNLLYTAVTRARELVVIVGSRKALHIALGASQEERRCTRLAARLRRLLPQAAENA